MGGERSGSSSEPLLSPVACSAPLSGPKIRELVASMSEEYISNKVVNPSIHSEQELLRPEMWRYPISLLHYCIYRVPNRLRDVNPEAYIPQLLLIGPLHHFLKAQASNCDITDKGYTKFMGYLDMEQHKKSYLKSFSERFEDENVINGMKRTIEKEEKMIRGSYSKPTTWIQSQEFVEMILHDSVFILEFILRLFCTGGNSTRTGDVLMDVPTIWNTIYEDLILLENQLPYFILQRLFDPIVPIFFCNFKTFRDLIVFFFQFEDKIKDDTEFKHFTDLFRCVRVETLKSKEKEAGSESKIEVDATRTKKYIDYMYNVKKLENAGVEFKALDEESLEVTFEKGFLKLPCFHVEDSTERILRNIMAFEQCHYPEQAYVCSYVIFMDFLIDTHKDVDILVGKGIIKNRLVNHGYVAEMVNRLSLGVVDFGFDYYYDIATKVNVYCENPINRACAMYFGKLLIGTATLFGMFISLMTLIEAVVSLMQFIQK